MYTFILWTYLASVKFIINKLVRNNISKDRSFQPFLVLDVLTNPDRDTHEKGDILGKNPLPISLFTYYSQKIKFVPFLKG